MAKFISNHMKIHPENNWGSVNYDDRFDEYYIDLKNSDNVVQLITYCPWCGAKLPESARDRWFDELEALGLDPMKDEVPEAYKTSAWRRVH